MKAKLKQTVRQQLDKTLKPFASLKEAPRPVKGWIKAVREALGMPGKQAAIRMGVSPQRITKLEQDELTGALTIKSMRQMAETLDCDFVYALVPKTSLEDTVRRQAYRLVRDRIKRVSHSMLLEEQSLSKEEAKASIEAAVENVVREMPRELWDARK